MYELGVLYYRDAQGRAAGIDKDLIEALAQRSGCKLDMVLESRARIWAQMAAGQMDLTVSAIPTPEREQFAELTPYMRTRNHVLIHKDLAARMDSLNTFKDETPRRVVVVKGYRHGRVFDAWLDEMRAQRRVVEASSYDNAMRMLRAGRADMMFTEPINLRSKDETWMREMRLLDWAPSDDVLACLVVSRTRVSEADRHRLRAALHSMLQDGTIDQLLRRHVGDAMLAHTRLAPSSQFKGTDNREHALQPRPPGT
ncbi:substrate-binding periplasmic protein [Paucibacter soli]|uniref:substrate-binding periplasmic protein n=1 Tax=Paucibacter soli TaxID=3133433 RepID=UPI0030A6A6BF